MSVVLLLSLAGCSGVPRSSLPQVVRTVDSGGDAVAAPIVAPDVNAEPRAIVSGFLQANVSNDETHPAARQFLAPAVRTKWSATTATIVSDYSIGLPDAKTNVIKVVAPVLGTLDDKGIYTPVPPDVTVQPPLAIAFDLVHTAAGWRITNPPVGLVIKKQDFSTAYSLRPMYFFNLTETKLVPDLRYSAAQGQSLATWALTQLLAGPQTGQQNVRLNEFPDQVDPLRAKVVSGRPVSVQLPGISQADATTVARVAAQLAYTFDSFMPGSKLTLVDGINPVRYPNVPAQFSQSDFASVDPISDEAGQAVYFLRAGALFGANGQAVSGPVGTTRYHLRSVSISNAGDGSPVRVAGVGRNASRLQAGTQAGGLRPVWLPGPVTARPEWTHDSPREVWVGSGTRIERVVGSTAQRVVFTATQSVELTGRTVVALRFSPEGARVALVLRAVDGSSSAWIGQVLRTSRSVQVEDLRQITPATWNVTDVAWADAVRLRVIDDTADSDSFQIWSLRADGSDARTSAGADVLPGTPQWITATADGLTWVSINGTLWVEAFDGSWSPPFGGRQQVGVAPVYAD